MMTIARLASWLSGAALAGAIASCAIAPGSSKVSLQSEDFMIPAADEGIALFIRNKKISGSAAVGGDKTVLFVHGATYPSETTFDLVLGGQSWMEYIAQHGYDVWLLDVRGYGRSTRPPAMAQAPSANSPFADTEEAVRDIDAAVDFILKRRGIAKLNLLGWSWGTTTTALYTTRHNERVSKLMLYAPVWTLPPSGSGPTVPTTSYRTVTIDAARARWYQGVAADKQTDLIPPGWFDTWAAAILASDPEGALQSPPVVRAPNGVFVDIFGSWLQGKRLYDPALIRVPTLLIKGEWDADTPAVMAQGLFKALTAVPYKAYIEVGEATHSLMMEKNRLQLWRGVQAFLDEPAR